MVTTGVAIKGGKVLTEGGFVNIAPIIAGCDICCGAPLPSDVLDIVQDGLHIWVCGDIGAPASDNIQQGKRLKTDGSVVWTNLASPSAVALTREAGDDTYWGDGVLAVGNLRKLNSAGVQQWTSVIGTHQPLRAARDASQSPVVLTHCGTGFPTATGTTEVGVNDVTGAQLQVRHTLDRTRDIQSDGTGYYEVGEEVFGPGFINAVKWSLGAVGPTPPLLWAVKLNPARAFQDVTAVRCKLGTSALFIWGIEDVVPVTGSRFNKLWALDKTTGATLATFTPHGVVGQGSQVRAFGMDVIGDSVYIVGSNMPTGNPTGAPVSQIVFWKVPFTGAAFGAPTKTLTITALHPGPFQFDGSPSEDRWLNAVAADGTDIFFGMESFVALDGPNLWSVDEGTLAINWDLL